MPRSFHALALALALAGCNEAGPTSVVRRPEPEVGPRPLPAPAPTDELPALMDALAAAVVRHDAPFRPVLYTWTTAEQAEELRARPRLLTRETTAAGQRARFDVALAADPGPVAALLRQPGRTTRRFAWPTPWATAMGWDGQGYGPVLVRVELAPEAIVARFEPGMPWRFFVAGGGEIGEAEVLAAPERLAAVYHVAAPEGERPGFREFVLVQERAIATWSIGTDAIRGTIADEADLLGRVAERIDVVRALAAARCQSRGAERCAEAMIAEDGAELAAWSAGLISGPWTEAPPPADVLIADLYAADLALPAAVYAPTSARLHAIAERLRALVDQPPPMTVRPDLVDIDDPQPARPARSAKQRASLPCSDPSLLCDPPRSRP